MKAFLRTNGQLQVAEMKFPPGIVGLTPGIVNAFEGLDDTPLDYLLRHFKGDWGDLEKSDVRENELGLKEGHQLFSIYHIENGTEIYIITAANRSSTTICLPEEYRDE